MRVKIVGDGTYRNTRVETPNGDYIQGIKSMTAKMESDDLLHVHLDMYFIPVEIEAELDSIKLVDQRYMGDETLRDIILNEKFKYSMSNEHPYPCPICNPYEYDKKVSEGKIKDILKV